MNKADELRDAAAAVVEAKDELDLKKSAAREASRAETEATNRLNDAQKKFDAILASFKKESSGDWARN